MSETIQRLLEIEQQARRIIEEAEEDADRIVAEAREQARRIRSEGREDARQRAQEMIDRNAEELRRQRRRRVREEQERLPSPEDLAPEKLDEAARLAVRVIAYGDEEA